MNIIKRIIKKYIRTKIDLYFKLGKEKKLFNVKGIKSRILMYHGVDKIENKAFNLRFIGVDSFENQVKYLKNNFNVVSLKDYFDKKFEKDKLNVAITFDDGYLNNYKYAFPILEKYEIPATIFVTGLNCTPYNILWADFIDISYTLTNNDIKVKDRIFIKKENGQYYDKNNGENLKKLMKLYDYEFKNEVFKCFNEYVNFMSDPSLFDYWKLMTDEQIIEISKSKYVSIGSHAFMHNNLGNIPFEEAKKEMIDSKTYLENIIKKEVDSISYPDGSYTKEVIDFAQKIGFKYQLAAYKYVFEDDIYDNRIEDRYGFYPAFSWCNQIYDMFKLI